MSNRREGNAVAAVGLLLAASAVLSAESPVIEAWLNQWVITAIVVALAVAGVVVGIRALWRRWSE